MSTFGGSTSRPFIPRCSVSGCNQQRCLSDDRCGTHRREAEKAAEAQDEHDDLVDRINAAETIDDIKEILVEHLCR